MMERARNRVVSGGLRGSWKHLCLALPLAVLLAPTGACTPSQPTSDSAPGAAAETATGAPAESANVAPVESTSVPTANPIEGSGSDAPTEPVAARGTGPLAEGSDEPPPSSGINLTLTTSADSGAVTVDVTVASAITATSLQVRLRPDPDLALDVTSPLELGAVTPGEVRHVTFTVTVPDTGAHRLGVGAQAHSNGHVVAASTRWLRWGDSDAAAPTPVGPELRVLETGERLLVTRSTRQIQAEGSGEAEAEEGSGEDPAR